MQSAQCRSTVALRRLVSSPRYSGRFSKAVAALILALMAGNLAACGPQAGQQPAPSSQGDGVIAVATPSPSVITANGVLVPVRRMTLSFGTSGFVTSMTTEIGAVVPKGETLATLDTANLQQVVVQEALNVESARGRLAEVQAQAQPIPEQVLAATTAISSAQAALAQAKAVAGQQGNQSILDQAALTQASQALRDAEGAYQQLLDSSVTRDWAPYSPAAKALEDAQEHHRLTLAEYNLHTADRSPDAAIAVAEAQLAQAQLALYEAEHPIAPESVALAELQVRRAEQALIQAKAELEHTSLTAPFDGTIAAVNAEPGEWASAGAPIIEILDLSRWRIETKNVGEREISQVRAGQTATVRINAFQGEPPLQGRIVAISPVAVIQQGDTTYTLVIEIESTDLNLRPGMTAQVEIEVDD